MNILRPETPLPWSAARPVHSELLAAKHLLYDACGFQCSHPVPEAESAEYGAHGLTVNGLAVRFRVAKTTPTKAGQFVTLWQRFAGGAIRPFDAEDAVDVFIISSRTDHGFGQFVFPRTVLAARGILSTAGAGGKRGFRIYPPGVATASKQAGHTQAWQSAFFLDLQPDQEPDLVRASALYQPCATVAQV